MNLMEIEFNQILSFNKSFNKSEKVSYVYLIIKSEHTLNFLLR